MSNRKDRLSQFTFDDHGILQNEIKSSQRDGRRCSSSFDESYYSAKFKTRRKSVDSFNESACNTIKLIDKVLDQSSVQNLKQVRRSSLDKEFFQVPHSNKENLFKLQSKLRDKSSPSATSSSLFEDFNTSNAGSFFKGKRRSVSANRKRPSISRPISLDLPSELSTSENRSTAVAEDRMINQLENLSYSLDELNFGADGINDRHSGVNSFLKRLDKELSNLVEKEKRKIVTMETQENGELYNKRSCRSSVASRQVVSGSRDSIVNENDSYHQLPLKPIKSKRYQYTDYDMLEWHKECFTRSRPHKPRILKTDRQSELVSMTKCYQVPRPKRKKKKRVVKQVDIGENISNYSDDFENSDSASDGNTNSSSEQESIEEIVECEYIPEHQNGIKKESLIQQEQILSSTKSSKSDNNLNSSNLFNNETNSGFAKTKENENKELKHVDDEEDTCYGSDHLGSDSIYNQIDKTKPQSKVLPVEYGENSIDSAYTGSREATPDIASSGSEQHQAGFKSKPKHYSIQSERLRSASFVITTETGAQRMNDAKLFLLEKIKDSGIYSDSNINSLLDYYSRKWHHIPEREMKLIVSFIRRDLGVKAPPRTYIDYLLKQDELASGNKKFKYGSLENEAPGDHLTTEECVSALSSTLTPYLRSYRNNRKAASTSCSPEPSIFFGHEANLNILSGKSRQEYEPASCVREQSMITQKPQSRNKEINKASGSRDSGSDQLLTQTELRQNTTKQQGGSCQRRVCKSRSNSDFLNGYEDEDRLRRNVGYQILEEPKQAILSNATQSARQTDAEQDDVEKMAIEICERFGIVL